MKPGNPIDSRVLRPVAVRIPPLTVVSEADVREPGLYYISQAEKIALYLHSHQHGRLVCDGWVSLAAVEAAGGDRFLRSWITNRGLKIRGPAEAKH